MTKAPKRPRDLNQWAKRMVDIATGEVEDRELTPEEQGKDPAGTAAFFEGPQGVQRLPPLAQRLHPDFARRPDQQVAAVPHRFLKRAACPAKSNRFHPSSRAHWGCLSAPSGDQVRLPHICLATAGRRGWLHCRGRA
jgi:hypothetical protein